MLYVCHIIDRVQIKCHMYTSTPPPYIYTYMHISHGTNTTNVEYLHTYPALGP